MKVLVVDDHPLVREGLASVIRQLGADTHVLSAGDAPAALLLAADHADLDLVVLDLMMPGMDGARALIEFMRCLPAVPIVVLSASEDPADARRVFEHGARGYVPKSAGAPTLLAALRLVLAGDLYIPPLILSAAGMRSGAARLAGLTERQVEVLRHIAEGHSNAKIAADLTLSEKTVKSHITSIFKALNVFSRTQAAAAARESGLV
jgi:DNA-binding NarL/FixJ family response regulator